MPEDPGFLGRWSRRKAQARTGHDPAEALPLPTPPAPAPAVPLPAAAALPGAVAPAPPPATGVGAAPASSAAPEAAPPPLTLDDVAALRLEDDFSPFVDRAVAPEVRNAAMKKLFADPSFNVMDGLDIYIDDYSKPDPLPAALARQLVSAQFMKLFDTPVAAEPGPDAATVPGVAPAAAPVAAPSLPAPAPAAPAAAAAGVSASLPVPPADPLP